MITFGDKTTTLTNTKRASRTKNHSTQSNAPEPRGTFKPLWDTIPDDTITN